MIRELSLERFGRFENKTFAFGDTVIFCGPNESGKTTLYDAIFTTLCKVKKQGRYATNITKRYGNRMLASIRPAELTGSFDVDEFEDLYSIRSGDIELNIEEDKGWVAAVRDVLFSGGINPADLAKVMENLASDNRNLKHNRDLAQLEERLTEARSMSERLEKRRKEHGEREKRGEDLKVKIGEIESEIQEQAKEIAGLEKEIGYQEKIRRRKELNDANRFLLEEERLVERSRELGNVTPEVLENVTGLNRNLDDIKKRENAESAVVERLNIDCGRLESAKLETERKSAEGINSASVARRLVEKIRDFLGDATRRTVRIVVWNKPLVVFLMVIAGVSIVLGIVWNPLCALGMLAGLGLLIARREELVENVEVNKTLAGQVRDAFRTASGVSLGSQSLDSLMAELEKFVHQHETLSATIAEKAQQIESLRNEIRERTSALQKISAQFKDIREKEGDVLRGCGVNTDLELSVLLTERNTVAHRLQEVKATIDARMATSGSRDRESYAAEVSRQLSDMDREAIPSEGKSEREIQEIRNRWNDATKLKEELTGDASKLELESAGLLGVTDYLGGVLDELMAAEKEKGEITDKITACRLDKEAASLARDIFLNCTGNSDALFAQLALDLGETFKDLVPGGREITVTKFSANGIQVADAGNVVRPIAHLSRGTRDCFVFAARLTLALKADPEKKKRLLVLDEPFHSLDFERTLNALRMVRKVQDEQGWQVILFTKDATLAKVAVDLLKRGVRYELE